MSDPIQWLKIVTDFSLDEAISADYLDSGLRPREDIIKEGLQWAFKALKKSSELIPEVCDHDDQIYGPLIRDVKCFENDWLIVDEAQDTNPARRLLARKMLKRNGRALFIGDPCQAIYMFTGADNDAMDVIIKEWNATVLKLTMTFRCPQVIVRMAQAFVPDYRAAPTNPEGEDSHQSGTRPKKLNWSRGRKPQKIEGEPLIEWVRDHAVDHDPDTGCWLTKTRKDYANVYVNGKVLLLHRYVYCVRTGMAYDDKSFVIRHLCHHKGCVNPDHLKHGTQRDNALDSRSNYKHVILTEDQVIQVAIAYRDTTFLEFGSIDRFTKHWSKVFGVSVGAINGIILRKSWSDITQRYLDSKNHVWKPRIPGTRLNPSIVSDIRADMPNWNFDEHGKKAQFDKKWAMLVGVKQQHVTNIRTGDRW